MVSNYSPKVFDNLYTFHTAKQSLSANERHLEKIGEVICRHGMEKHFGISLLHQHFPVNSHEWLVERVVERNTRIQPIAREENDKTISAYMWKVERDPTTGIANWFPLEFMRNTDFPDQSLADKQEFLEDVAARILDLGLEQTFGISLSHRDVITASPEEMLVETSSGKSRVIQFSPMLLEEINPEELLPTFWTFTPDNESDVGFACKGCCKGCCNQHPD